MEIQMDEDFNGIKTLMELRF